MMAGLLRPTRWVACALLIGALFAVMHLLGWRADTCIISGTVAGSGIARDLAVVRGLLYIVTYFCAITVAPILIIGAGLLAGISRLAAGRLYRS
jgi:hypothetical protein